MDQKTIVKVLGPAVAVGVVVLLFALVLAPPGAPPATTVTAAANNPSAPPADPAKDAEGTTLTLPPLDDPGWKPGPADGLKVWDTVEGTGEAAPAGATVRVHYTGWLTNGDIFDSSVKRGEPISFPLTGVIRGWTVGIPGMKVGGVRRLYIPADLAYGNQPQRGIPAGSTLVFEVKLLGVK